MHLCARAEPKDSFVRLAAIVAADVVGYSRLMGLEEVGTGRTLRLGSNKGIALNHMVQAQHFFQHAMALDRSTSTQCWARGAPSACH